METVTPCGAQTGAEDGAVKIDCKKVSFNEGISVCRKR